MAVKALLRIKLVITPMRAEDTVISSRTRRIWTDERNTSQVIRRNCDLRAQLPHHLRRRCDAGCQAAMRTRVAFSPMQWGVWRTRITLIGPDPSCPAADDCVFGAHRRDDQRKAQQSLVSHRACKTAPTRHEHRGAGGPTLRRNGSHLRNGDGYFFDGEHLGVPSDFFYFSRGRARIPTVKVPPQGGTWPHVKTSSYQFAPVKKTSEK